METFSLKVKHVIFHLDYNYGQCLAFLQWKHFPFGHAFESNFLLATPRTTSLPNCLVLLFLFFLPLPFN